MTPKIFIGHDFFGAGNFGDDLMLDGFLRSLLQSGKQAEVIACIPHDIDSQRRRFPTIKWLSAADGQHREEQLRRADVWLGLGDTPLQLASGPWSLDHLERERELCSRLRKPMLFLGVGCESPEAVRDPRGRRVIQAAERIWTRDGRSADAIDGAATAGVVVQGADLAHISLGAAAVRPAPEPDLLGLLLGLERPEMVNMVAVDQEIARRLPAKTRWLVQETRSFPCTERWNYAGLSEWAQSSLDLMAMDYSTDTIEEFLGNFGAPETVVSSRYHGALIAAWHACRLGVIARTEKLDGVVADLDVPYMRRIAKADELEALARQAVPVERARLTVLRDRANAMCEAFFAWLGA
jgi:polysaccharide pyruvyl transferase WcaK-like protein